MVGAKHVSGKNIYWSTCIGKSKERKIFDFLHCPFEPPAKQHRPVSQLGWILWCMLARPSKGQCRNSKIFPPLLLTVKVDQNIFFPETCFASTISEPEFTVWIEKGKSIYRIMMLLHFLLFSPQDICCGIRFWFEVVAKGLCVWSYYHGKRGCWNITNVDKCG